MRKKDRLHALVYDSRNERYTVMGIDNAHKLEIGFFVHEDKWSSIRWENVPVGKPRGEEHKELRFRGQLITDGVIMVYDPREPGHIENMANEIRRLAGEEKSNQQMENARRY